MCTSLPRKIKSSVRGNIHIGSGFDFDELMPRGTAFINHGGQNSMMPGLIYGTLQIICPGNVFERRYNASSVERLKAGVSIETDDFTPERIRQLIQEFESDPSYRNNAMKVGERLLRLGGVSRAVDVLEEKFGV